MNLLEKTQLQNELTLMATDDPKGDTLMAEEGMEDYATFRLFKKFDS